MIVHVICFWCNFIPLPTRSLLVVPFAVTFTLFGVRFDLPLISFTHLFHPTFVSLSQCHFPLLLPSHSSSPRSLFHSSLRTSHRFAPLFVGICCIFSVYFRVLLARLSAACFVFKMFLPKPSPVFTLVLIHEHYRTKELTDQLIHPYGKGGGARWGGVTKRMTDVVGWCSEKFRLLQFNADLNCLTRVDPLSPIGVRNNQPLSMLKCH